MKYLKQITLKNFQSHKDSTIQLDRGLNAIIGPSDSGKSAIIRAIKWVLYNEPAGNFFIREGETESSVTLEFNDGTKIKRLRNKSKNMYVLYIQDDEMIFEGFGNKVPQEIIDLTGIQKVPLDSIESNAINLGEQLEGAFLLSEKGSTRASAIGRIVGVNIIDDALKETLKDVRNISIREKTIIDNIEKIEKELVGYEYLDDLKKDIIKLENIKNIIDMKISTKNIFSKILEDYNTLIKEKKYINEVLSKLNTINTLEKNIDSLEMRNRKLISYKKISTNFSENKQQLTYYKKTLGKLDNNNIISNIVFKIDYLINRLEKFDKFTKQRNYYKREIEQMILIDESFKNLDNIKIKVNIIQVKIDRLKKLKYIINRIELNNLNLNTGIAYMERLKNLDMIDNLYANLNMKIRRKTLISNLLTVFSSCKIQINNQNNILNNSRKDLEDKLKIYEKLLLKNKICPLCLNDINKDRIQHIIEHYS